MKSPWLLKVCILAELFTNQHSMLSDDTDTAAPSIVFDYRQKENFMDNGRQSVPRWNPDEDFSRFNGHKGSYVRPNGPEWRRYPEGTMSSRFIDDDDFWVYFSIGSCVLVVVIFVFGLCYINCQPIKIGRAPEVQGQEIELNPLNQRDIPEIIVHPPPDDEEED